MPLRTEIEQKLQVVLKERNKLQTSTLRLILAAIKDKDISVRTKESKEGIKDNDIKQLLKKMIKQRNESIELYKKNNRNDLLEIEKGEIEIISSFLPRQFNDEETLKICKETIQSTKAEGLKNMGKVMGTIKKKYADVLDFSKVGSLVRELLK